MPLVCQSIYFSANMKTFVSLSKFFFCSFYLWQVRLGMMLAFQVILTVAEHHSCIVPWQIVSQKTGAVLKFVTLNDDEIPDIDMLREMISSKTKLVAVHHVSNVLGRFLFHVLIIVYLFSVYVVFFFP